MTRRLKKFDFTGDIEHCRELIGESKQAALRDAARRFIGLAERYHKAVEANDEEQAFELLLACTEAMREVESWA